MDQWEDGMVMDIIFFAGAIEIVDFWTKNRTHTSSGFW